MPKFVEFREEQHKKFREMIAQRLNLEPESHQVSYYLQELLRYAKTRQRDGEGGPSFREKLDEVPASTIRGFIIKIQDRDERRVLKSVGKQPDFETWAWDKQSGIKRKKGVSEEGPQR